MEGNTSNSLRENGRAPLHKSLVKSSDHARCMAFEERHPIEEHDDDDSMNSLEDTMAAYDEELELMEVVPSNVSSEVRPVSPLGSEDGIIHMESCTSSTTAIASGAAAAPHLPPTRSSRRARSRSPTFGMRPRADTVVFNVRSKLPTSNFFNIFMATMVVSLVWISTSTISISNIDKEISSLQNTNRDVFDKNIKSLEKDVRSLSRKLSAIDAQHSAQQQQATTSHPPGAAEKSHDELEVDHLKEKVQVLSNNAELLRAQIQAISKNEVLQKYGPGPHRVEIELIFPAKMKKDVTANHLRNHDEQETLNTNDEQQLEDDDDLLPTTFIIELAPLDVMPHSVHFFLDMVSSNLLNGCSFVLNALHVLKAAPLPYEGAGVTVSEKAKQFMKHGMDTGVSFKEYSDSYKHTLYTIGFAVDESPSFYINTEDNSEVHDGYPCFGQIVSGMDAIQRLENTPVRNGIWLQNRIGIKRATILPPPRQ